MNRSIVISRYGLTLVKYVRATGQGEIVCAQAEALEKAISSVPDLRRMVTAADDVVKPAEKLKLLETALGGQMSPEMRRFLTLLNDNGRMNLLEDILRDFLNIYRRSIGVRKAHLTTVGQPSERLLQRLREVVKQKTGDDVIIEVSVDPSIVGGFVFDLDEYLMDASVKHQLDLIREEFIERNRRII